MARTSLMTPILFAPASRRTTVNSVCASAAGGGGSGSGGGGGDGSGGGNAPLAFEIFDEGGEIENRLAGQPFDDLVFGDVAHVIFS